MKLIFAAAIGIAALAVLVSVAVLSRAPAAPRAGPGAVSWVSAAAAGHGGGCQDLLELTASAPEGNPGAATGSGAYTGGPGCPGVQPGAQAFSVVCFELSASGADAHVAGKTAAGGYLLIHLRASRAGAAGAFGLQAAVRPDLADRCGTRLLDARRITSGSIAVGAVL